MTRAPRFLLATLLTLSFSWLWAAPRASAQSVSKVKVRGSATYRERVALIPTAVFEAKLLDVSRADAPERTIAQMRRGTPGQVPISFELSYDPRRTDPRMRFVVRASILVGNKVRFTGDSPYAAPAAGADSRVSVLMRAVSEESATASATRSLAGTYAGLLPCSDCSGIRYQLNLLRDGAYMQRATYLRDGHDDSFYDLGRWSLSPDARILTLDGERQGETFWSPKDRETLRKVDRSGKPVSAKTPYELKRRPAFESIEPRLKMSGMFRYMADAARFRECQSGFEWPVAMIEDYRTLERAYAKRSAPGAELFVSLKGRVEQRPKIDGAGTQATLIVENFVSASPDERCPGVRTQAGLENSRWVPTRIGARTVAAAGGQREPWIAFDSRSKRASGSGGCNRMSGTYEAGDGTLRFGPMIATQMACVGIEYEVAFLQALERTRRYRVSGRILELMDGGGKVLARLEERSRR